MSDNRTLGRMIKRISREIRRDGLTADIRESIETAVDYYKSERFWFNEEEATASMTVGQDTYDLPVGYLELDEIHVEDSAGQKYKLTLVPYETMDRIQTQTEAWPEVYSIYRDQLFVRPVTNRMLTMRMSYLKEIDLTASATTTTTNVWTTHGEPLIRSHAKREVYQNRLRNEGMAAQMFARARREEIVLKRRTAGYVSFGKIKKTRF